MLSSAKRVGSRKSYAQTELIHTIRRCGLTSGLKLCLDAGDANSYSGSGQSWLDTSGNGYDFFRGATGGSEASDPTYNGTAGQRTSTNYWSFDGGDYFRYDSANETWMNNLHKDNAKFTLMAFFQFGGTGTIGGLFGTTGGGASTGIEWYLDTANPPNHVFRVRDAVGGQAAIFLAAGPSAGVPVFMAVSVDEAVGANGAIQYLNGVQTLSTSTYTTPSAGAAAFTSEIGARGNAESPIVNTSRMGMFAAWEGVALTQEQLNALYMHTRGRFGV